MEPSEGWRWLSVVPRTCGHLPVEYHDRRSRRLAAAGRRRCKNKVEDAGGGRFEGGRRFRLSRPKFIYDFDTNWYDVS